MDGCFCFLRERNTGTIAQSGGTVWRERAQHGWKLCYDRVWYQQLVMDEWKEIIQNPLESHFLLFSLLVDGNVMVKVSNTFVMAWLHLLFHHYNELNQITQTPQLVT